MLTALIGPIANLAGSWMNSKVEKVKADGQAKVAQARAKAVVAEKVATGEVAWESLWLMLRMEVGKTSLP